MVLISSSLISDVEHLLMPSVSLPIFLLDDLCIDVVGVGIPFYSKFLPLSLLIFAFHI